MNQEIAKNHSLKITSSFNNNLCYKQERKLNHKKFLIQGFASKYINVTVCVCTMYIVQVVVFNVNKIKFSPEFMATYASSPLNISMTVIVNNTLIKKKIKISSYIREFRVEQLQSHTVYEEGFLIYEEMRKYFPI
jgi:hypothetical protein